VLQCRGNGSLFPEGLDCPGSLGRELGQNAVEVLEIQQLTFCTCRLIGDFIKEEMADQFFTNIGNKIESFFGGGDALPWTDSEMIATCEQEAGVSGGDKSESIMRLAWALVHSRNAPDVQRGIAMLEASLSGQGASMQKREILYLLAVGQYRAGEYARSRRLVDQALLIAPDFRQAAALKTMVEDKIAKDGLVGVGLAAAAVGVVASGIAAAVLGARRR